MTLLSPSPTPPKTLTPGSPTDEPADQIHLEFIRDQATSEAENGAESVESYHRSLFLYRHAPELERWEQQARLHEHRLRGLELQLGELETQLTSLPHLLANPLASSEGENATPPASTPWNGWDVTMFVLAGIGVVGLLLFGIFNISFNLLESGLVTFQENPIRAYFWAALLPAGALAVKVGWDCLRSLRLRSRYLWGCLASGLLGVLLWLAAYAAVYPSLSKGTAERIQSLSVFAAPTPEAGWLLGSNSAGTRWVDILLVASQATAEIFLSSVLGIYMTQLFQRHHALRSSKNPRFSQIDQRRLQIQTEVTQERMGLAEARGQRQRLEHQLTAVLAYAHSSWLREVALRRDHSHQQRILLDQITSQLREQLSGLTGNGSFNPKSIPPVAESNSRP